MAEERFVEPASKGISKLEAHDNSENISTTEGNAFIAHSANREPGELSRRNICQVTSSATSCDSCTDAPTASPPKATHVSTLSSAPLDEVKSRTDIGPPAAQGMTFV